MNKLLPVLLIIVAAGSFALGSAFNINLSTSPSPSPASSADDSALASQVLPANGVELPIKWSNLGVQLVETGVIDITKFEGTYSQRGGLSEPEKALLTGADNGNITINQANSGLILNLLWALGLGNKNSVLDTGPMVDKQYGGAGNFASTGGWSLSSGTAMSHYSKHSFVTLTTDQQALVDEVSKGIFRPCCNNATYFPDCNHGMAMLGLLQLMAAQGVNKEEMYKYALAVNAYWFPDTYVNIAKYKASQGINWDKVDPAEVLGETYSSATGYQQILSKIEPAQLRGGGSCGV